MAIAGLLLDAEGNRATKKTIRRFAGRIRTRAIRCGKECKKCPHGHYLYLCWRVGRKAREKYLGKSDSAAVALHSQPDSVPKRAGKNVPPAKDRPAPTRLEVSKADKKTPSRQPAFSPITESAKPVRLGAWRRSTSGTGRKRTHWVLAARTQQEAAALMGVPVARFRTLWKPAVAGRRGHLSGVITENFGPGLLVARSSTSITAAELRPATADDWRRLDVDRPTTTRSVKTWRVVLESKNRRPWLVAAYSDQDAARLCGWCAKEGNTNQQQAALGDFRRAARQVEVPWMEGRSLWRGTSAHAALGRRADWRKRPLQKSG